MKYTLFLCMLVIFPVYSVFANIKTHQDGTTISVYYQGTHIEDTLYLNVLDDFSTTNSTVKYSLRAKRDNYGQFTFKIPETLDCGFLEIGIKNRNDLSVGETEEIFRYAFFEKGDSIHIDIHEIPDVPAYEYNLYQKFKYRYSGKGSRKWQLKEEADSVMREMENFDLKPSKMISHDVSYIFTDIKESSTMAAIAYLSANKADISPLAFQVFLTDIVYRSSKSKFLRIREYYTSNVLTRGDSEKEKFRVAYQQFFAGFFSKYSIEQQGLNQSHIFLTYLFYKNQTDCLVFEDSISPDLCFDRILSQYEGEIRDRLLVRHLVFDYNSPLFNEQLEIAEKIITTDYSKEALKDLVSRLSGRQAFDFALSDPLGNIVKLSDFEGKVVVMDFWFTGCGGCRVFYTNVFSKVEEFYKNNENVAFISVSVDRNKQKWIESIKGGAYTNDDVVNVFTMGEGYNHEMIKHYKVQFYPTSLLINKKGNVAIFNANSIKDNPENFINSIQELL